MNSCYPGAFAPGFFYGYQLVVRRKHVMIDLFGKYVANK
jgi:hypothetical protein